MDVKLPSLGEGADSGTVVSVLVKPGAPVKKGQNIIELETGKAVAPIPSPGSGTVSRIAVKEGDQIAVGQLILVLESAEGASAGGSPGTGDGAGATSGREGASKPAKGGGAKAGRAKAAAAAPPPKPVAAPSTDEEASSGGETEEDIITENPAAGPYVRRVARDLGMDLRVIAGSGKSGQILIGDLKEYVLRLRARANRPERVAVAAEDRQEVTKAPERPVPASVDFSQWGPVNRKPMSVLRKTIASRMVDSATRLPAVTQFHEADVTAADGLRKTHAKAYEARGARLTLTAMVIQSVAGVLRKHPILNASLDEGTSEIVFKDYIHLGIAVDTEAGLLVPVLRDADRKSLLQISQELQELAVRARERKLALADMQGGTFTISNQGGIGGGHFTPIINAPEVAILGLGRSVVKPVWHGEAIAARLMMPLALTYDHRLIDGGAAARFTVDLAAALEGWVDDAVKL